MKSGLDPEVEAVNKKLLELAALQKQLSQISRSARLFNNPDNTVTKKRRSHVQQQTKQFLDSREETLKPNKKEVQAKLDNLIKEIVEFDNKHDHPIDPNDPSFMEFRH